MMSRGRDVVDFMQDSFRRLENVIAAVNDRGIRMLRFWGFEVGQDVQVFGGTDFLPFWRGANV
jgi:hypothetical protein